MIGLNTFLDSQKQPIEKKRYRIIWSRNAFYQLGFSIDDRPILGYFVAPQNALGEYNILNSKYYPL